jgi:CheY-specific phosphatase CheX
VPGCSELVSLVGQREKNRWRYVKMHDKRSHTKGYVLAAALGAIGGGLIVALATKAVPKIASQMMSGMMQNMMARMAKAGCNPAEM